jgi:hypothetical protein
MFYKTIDIGIKSIVYTNRLGRSDRKTATLIDSQWGEQVSVGLYRNLEVK